ncbi:MAG TPA: peptidoglycan editing factor PgeF [Burkholderiales bacterium]
MSFPSDWIVPHWPAPARVRAVITTRAGGVSPAPYGSMNFGLRSGDTEENVRRNRALLRAGLPDEPKWVHQVHGSRTLRAESVEGAPQADASVAHRTGTVCVVMAADCMPVLLCDRGGTAVGAAHAGWRGLAGGVIENTMRELNRAPAEVLAYLGPCIGPAQFEVGADVLEAFAAHDAQAVRAFRPYSGRPGKWLCDLYALARQRLHAAGVRAVYGGGFCTVNDQRFFSHRRDRGASGRMAGLIWLE